ncbi:MAG: AEC family transporter [Methanobacteriaceae archaeon]|jgi:auxin efflux carrier (AEC)|nr:AEC family transporter [Methanobacteriaceae archaeon]OPY23238.1 MAG: putative transporter YfdV [Methanobacterium sp. PtaU1.Bin097]
MNSYETIIAIVVLILIGYICRRLEFLRPEDAKTLNKIVVYIAIPSLIFLAMSRADLSGIATLGTITLICLMVGLVCGVIAYIFAHLMNYSKKTKWTLVTTSAMLNSGFMGYPVVLGVFGGAGMVSAVFYDIGSVIIFISFGLLLILAYGGKFQDILRESVFFPSIIAITLGILANLLNIPLGNIVPNILDYLSGAAIPLIMLSLGLSLEFKEVKERFNLASFVTVIRLVISPLIAIALATILGLSGLNYSVAVVQAGMPSGMLTMVLAIAYNLDVKVTAACVFLSTALSMVSLTVLILLL